MWPIGLLHVIYLLKGLPPHHPLFGRCSRWVYRCCSGDSASTSGPVVGATNNFSCVECSKLIGSGPQSEVAEAAQPVAVADISAVTSVDRGEGIAAGVEEEETAEAAAEAEEAEEAEEADEQVTVAVEEEEQEEEEDPSWGGYTPSAV